MSLMKNVLVTGGAGFIGSHLVALLQENGFRVRVLDDFSIGRRDYLDPGTETIEGDVRNANACREACDGVDIVFHLAARVAIRGSDSAFREDCETNVLGTLSLLDAARQAKIKRFVLASSMAVYSESTPATRVSEDHPTIPLSPYGVGKLAAEHYVRVLCHANQIEPVILRLFNTHGIRQQYSPYVGVLTIFVNRCLEGRPCLIFGDGQQCRDFVAVEDVARALLLGGTVPQAAGHILNVGTGVSTSVETLAKWITDHLHGTIEYTDASPVELRYSVANISQARQVLGYEPSRQLKDEIKNVVDSIVAQSSQSSEN